MQHAEHAVNANAVVAAAASTSIHHRSSHILGGIERVADGTGEKLREEFLSFLERFTMDDATGVSGLSQRNHQQHPYSRAQTSNALFTGMSELDNTAMDQHSPNPPQLASNSAPWYQQQLFEMRNEGGCTLYVDFNHLVSYNDVLASAIASNYYRFEPFLRAAIAQFVAHHIPSYARASANGSLRDFWISIYNINVTHRLRELTTQKVGQLISINGTVTRTSEVRPELFVGAFQCAECSAIIRNVEQQFKYTEPTICISANCQNRRDWTLVPEQSVFVNWQRVRVQENANEIPPGSMPRCIDVIVRHDMVERSKAGDRCSFVGTLIVVPDVAQLALPGNRLERAGQRNPNAANDNGISGLKALGVRELTYRLAFLANMVQSPSDNHQQLNSDLINEDEQDIDPATLFTASELEEIHAMRNSPDLFARMAMSIAPSIYGHAEVKAGILLMLFGGVHKTTSEGISLRGDINVCIVGDPGVAKSQFLRHVSTILPRAVYTSGKASSAAGLTASVLKDEETGDFTIEAGALMLADNGICAIDEFDKMDLKDQVAIHEAMEQQTITIAKAGIHASLNARTSILAAANPIHGRYDRRKTLRQNIAMTAPIMSRFDLFFVVLDEGDENADYSIARHILNVHRQRQSSINAPFTSEQLQRYIRYARTIRPRMTKDAAELLIERYVQLRQSDATGAGSAYRMTVRQLESMVRLSEAIARVYCDTEIKESYVREAARLLKASIIRVEADNVDLKTATTTGSTLLAPGGLSSSMAIMSDDARTSAAIATDDPQSMAHLSIRYEDYVRVSNMMVYQLRRIETLANEQQSQMAGDFQDSSMMSDSDKTSSLGLTRQALIEWYLEQVESELQTEADFFARQRQAAAIIERLVRKDGVLIEISAGNDQSVLIVHPNYVPV